MLKRNAALPSLLLIIVFCVSGRTFAHCQIPCGIYDDYARVASMLEDARTIEKSVNELIAHSKDKDIQAMNQRVRWINNKEVYAEKIIQTTADYFLTQRVKPEQSDYAERLMKHHRIMLLAMKCKQTVDPKVVQSLISAIEDLTVYYPKPQAVKEENNAGKP